MPIRAKTGSRYGRKTSSIPGGRSSIRIIICGTAAGRRYMIEELVDDIASGHNIIATVYVEARSMYRAGGPEAFRPVGEVEFANGAAAMSASGGYGPAAICAGIVGHVNLLLGEGARAVLEAEIAAGGGRFRGIRHSSPWDADPHVAGMYATRPKGLLLDATFRKGFACLAPLDLSFDAWLFHPQIGELADLARAFPDTKIVLDHCGGPIGVGGYANRREEIFKGWKASIQDIAKCRNVVVKLGGLAMKLLGYDFHERAEAAIVGGRSPPRGGPISRPASKPSARSAACSKATFRPTRASAAIR